MNEFSEQSKIWVYQADRDLQDSEISELQNRLSVFCKEWTAHNQQLKAGFKLLYKRFIIMIVDETATNASGCSIDKSVAFLKSISQEFNTDLFGRLNMAYLEGDKVQTIHIKDIDASFKNGNIKEDSIFFNTNINFLEELDSDFLKPLMQHWLMRNISA